MSELKVGRKNRQTGSPSIRMGRQKGIWHPELVGKVPGYPKTLESYRRRQENGKASMAKAKERGTWCTRQGIGDGWGGRAEEARAEHERAREWAKRVVPDLIRRGILAPRS